jgi:hypothetical protein
MTQFLDAQPVLGDSDYVLLQKINQSLGNTTGEGTEQSLLREICRSVSTLYAGGSNPPDFLDSKNNLLLKIAKSLSVA